ncbi:MAG: MATE family efflux transporter, partial [Cyclobacteriaceae bacterium]
MEYKQHLKRTVSLSVPVVLSQLGHIAVTVADSAMVGQTGTVPLAAAAFAGSTFYAVLLFGIGITYAITPMVSGAYVKNDHQRIAGLLRNSLVIYPVVSVLLAALLIVISLFYDTFGQDPEVAQAAVPYLWLLALSVIPAVI